MSCRETHAGSAVTSYAKYLFNDSLSESFILSSFHELRRRRRQSTRVNQHTYSEREYRNLLRRYVARVHALENVSDARKQSIIHRLQAAMSEDVPPQDLLYALAHLPSTLQDRAEAIQRYCTVAARTAEVPVGQMRERFSVLEREADRRAPLSEEERAFALRHGSLGNDAGAIRAAIALREEADAVHQARNLAAPPRITRTELTRPVSGGSGMPYVAVRSIGYDERNQRVEIETSTRGTTRRTVYAYRNVPPAVFSLLSDPRTLADAWTAIRNSPASQYATQAEADADGRAPRCENCGQFSAAGHVCPETTATAPISRRGRRTTPPPAPTPRRTEPIIFRQHRYYYGGTPRGTVEVGNWSRQTVETANGETIRVDLPLVRAMRAAVNSGPVVIQDIYQWFADTYLRGDASVDRDSSGNLTVDTAGLTCRCGNPRPCQHVEYVEQAILARIDPRSDAVEMMRLRAAQRRLEQEMSENWITHPPYRAEAETTWRDDSDVLYSENPDAFWAAVERAKQAKQANNGEAVIPYMRENALDGLCQRGSGKGFGIEIEFDLNGPRSTEKIALIAQELYDAGITTSSRQQGYGASRRRGFIDTHTGTNGKGTWSFERDGSVTGGELVTPVMYDEPETWEKLEKAITIITRHGGTPSVSAGAHVHVGTGDYRRDAKNYTELIRLMNQHEDVMFRLASDTKRGTHRKTHYATPMPSVPPSGFETLDGVKRWQPTRTTAVNFQNTNGTRRSHAEFRLFDSTLNVGTIQAQVKLAVAATEAAKRIAANGGTSRGKEPVGAHKKRADAAQGRTTSREYADEDSGTTRSLLDVLFRRREDKEQLAAVYANTQWGSGTGRH